MYIGISYRYKKGVGYLFEYFWFFLIFCDIYMVILLIGDILDIVELLLERGSEEYIVWCLGNMIEWLFDYFLKLLSGENWS